MIGWQGVKKTNIETLQKKTQNAILKIVFKKKQRYCMKTLYNEFSVLIISQKKYSIKHHLY